MKNISITVHHEGTFAYDPLVYEYIDVDAVENVNLGNCNFERLMKIIRESCMFPVHVDGKFISDKDFGARLDTKSSSSRNVEVEDSFVDDRFKVKEGFSYHVHNPNLPWNEMAQLLGMKFEHLDQLKEYLINYRVANGYQLWYRRNDYRNISVMCGIM
uniref:S-adenosyl-L-methionine-dependent methyltransferase n=1 Tax=Tanacetum cinerariifolium TaxID=118510 RepID=A0A699J750_TANCI|nr:S-adenosyl-L-methionine-dependent methyltransferase [Tanacetum cinerariifolium]